MIRSTATCVPRRCGGVPHQGLCERCHSMCSPQVRGCSRQVTFSPTRQYVFPAGAGVFPTSRSGLAIISCVPRRCGGVPTALKLTGPTKRCSPQVRGCSYKAHNIILNSMVFPAGAGVFLAVNSSLQTTAECSPQVRGCSPLVRHLSTSFRVFPAGAGVFLLDEGEERRYLSVPRRCGGVPIIYSKTIKHKGCSPQVRGCSY